MTGTYVTQSAFTTAAKTKKDEDRPPLRGYLMSGDFFVGAALATVLTKLALRFPLVNSKVPRQNVSLGMLSSGAIYCMDENANE